MQQNPVTGLSVQLGERKITLSGRKAWALAALIDAGATGITTLSNPAPRMAHYIFQLRRDGFSIESDTEGHGGPFAGHHARYVLKSSLVELDRKRQHSAGRVAA